MNKKNYLLSALTLAVMAGCASQPSSDTASTAALEDFPEYQRLKDSRDELEQENAKLKAEVKESKTTVSGKVATAQSLESTSTTPTADSVMPPNATPGHCYARLVIPEEYETQMKQVMVSPELSKLEVEPAKYAMAEEQVLVNEEWEELVVVPATYKTVTEQVMVKEASTKLVKLPAEYKTVEEKIVIRPAYSTWKKGNGPIEKIDSATGEIMCLVEVPEESKIITKTILVKPERTEEVVIPAEYKAVSKQVVDVAAHTTTCRRDHRRNFGAHLRVPLIQQVAHRDDRLGRLVRLHAAAGQRGLYVRQRAALLMLSAAHRVVEAGHLAEGRHGPARERRGRRAAHAYSGSSSDQPGLGAGP